MKYNKQIMLILVLISMVVLLAWLIGNHIGILHILFFIGIYFLAKTIEHNQNRKINSLRKNSKVVSYESPHLIRWDIRYLFVWAKWGWGFDYLMVPQNMSLQNRIDQIIAWTQNTSGIRTILWKDKIESFEDFEELLQFIIWSVPPIGIIGDKTRYSMDFGSRRLNIIVQENWSVLTITF
jgi:hypothetical protein